VKRDLDSQMLAGCTAFVFVSMVAFGLSLWPFFAWPELWRTSNLALCCAVGFVPSAVLGAVFARRGGIPGASGYVAYAMAFSAFLYLRLEQIRMSALAQQTPELDYPAILGALIPLGWLLVSLFIAMACFRES
jgi:hypothetical protein